MNTVHRMPALFIGHGSPMHIVENDQFSLVLSSLGSKLPKPTAILVVSAHWLTHGTHITASPTPRQIFDFYGFPPELYEVLYTPPGKPDMAQEIASRSQLGIRPDDSWGLDHASWAVLHHLYPKQDIPVLELSLDLSLPPERHVEIGKELAILREQGVLVIGSGNLIHNLRMIRWETPGDPYPWAVEFDEFCREMLLTGQYDKLVPYNTFGHGGRLSIPTAEHYLPMLYVLGARHPEDNLRFIYEGIEMGSVSMRSFILE